ncbi:hypothetical protein FQY83_17345 [Luteimonas marina]|uniref:Uncharacterized protein n=1 Tax=Luteimonas marina TaxID=488485 RepID=A0A5C5TV50_9GAMM|nr:hypothetical protein [Luteimonas marina]TWT17105.1 hypothetical protein FQY83_17345 [Luteimonas marina]
MKVLMLLIGLAVGAVASGAYFKHQWNQDSKVLADSCNEAKQNWMSGSVALYNFKELLEKSKNSVYDPSKVKSCANQDVIYQGAISSYLRFHTDLPVPLVTAAANLAGASTQAKQSALLEETSRLFDECLINSRIELPEISLPPDE